MASLMQYCKKVGSSFVFIGNKMTIIIPRRYETYNLLHISNDVETLAIFEVIVDDKDSFGFLLPAVVTMEPSRVFTTTKDDVDVAMLEFQTGDKVIVNDTILKQPYISYMMFLEFVALGNLPKFLSYEDAAFLFDKSREICNANLRVNHSIFEMIFAHLFRDPDDLTKKYRHTDMTKKPAFIELRSVTYGTDSTTAKLIGAYMNDGINAAIVNPSDQRHDLEDLLRK